MYPFEAKYAQLHRNWHPILSWFKKNVYNLAKCIFGENLATEEKPAY